MNNKEEGVLCVCLLRVYIHKCLLCSLWGGCGVCFFSVSSFDFLNWMLVLMSVLGYFFNCYKVLCLHVELMKLNSKRNLRLAQGVSLDGTNEQRRSRYLGLYSIPGKGK